MATDSLLDAECDLRLRVIFEPDQLSGVRIEIRNYLTHFETDPRSVLEEEGRRRSNASVDAKTKRAGVTAEPQLRDQRLRGQKLFEPVAAV